MYSFLVMDKEEESWEILNGKYHHFEFYLKGAENNINAAGESSKHFESFAILYIPIIGDILCRYD